MSYEPDDDDREEQPEDWLFASVVFARALGRLLPKGMGVVLDVKDTSAEEIRPDIERVVVFNKGNQIAITADIQRYGNDKQKSPLKDGDIVQIVDFNDIKN